MLPGTPEPDPPAAFRDEAPAGVAGGAPTALAGRELALVFVGLTAAAILPAMSATSVSTALPTIGGELGSLSQMPWIVTTYLVASTVAVPVAGKVSDLYGRRLLLSWAITIFVAGSALCGLAQSMLQLGLARGVQGIGGGAIMALTFASIGDVVSARQRGRYQGYTFAAMASTSALGPLVGGLIADHLSWRWIFFLDIPLGGLALVLTLRYLRIRRPALADRSIDYAGAVLLMAGVVSAFLVVLWGGDTHGWASMPILGLMVAAATCLVAFAVVETRAAEPIIPFGLFRQEIVAVCCLVGFVMQGALFTAIVFVPLFLQIVSGASATVSGLVLMPLIASMMVANVVSGRLITRWGSYRMYPIAGTALTAAGLGLLATMQAGTSQAHVFASSVLIGAGAGLTNQVLILASQNAVPHRFLGVVTSGVQFFRMLGSTVALVGLGLVLDARITSIGELLPGGTVDVDRLVGDADALLDLPLAAQQVLREGFSEALTLIFLLGAVAAGLAFLAAWFLRDLPLGDHVGDDAPAAGQAVPGAGVDPAWRFPPEGSRTVTALGDS